MATGDPLVTGDEVAEFLRMDGGAASEGDDHLTIAASAASRWVHSYTRRDFNLGTTATARYYDVLHDGTVLTDDIGHATILVATDSSHDGTFATSWASTDFQAIPLDALTAGEPVTSLAAVGDYTFPRVSRRTGLVRVTARWGWPSVPSDVRLATLIQAAKLFKRRESAEGVLGGGDFGLVRVGSRVDPDVAALLDPYRYVMVG
jgi:hypothetical protein